MQPALGMPQAASPGLSATGTVRTMTYGAADVSEKVREAALHMGLYVPNTDAASENPNSVTLPAEADLRRRLS